MTDSDCSCNLYSPPSAEIEKSPLYHALGRFSQFFISPLFLSTSLQRELHAVDSENQKNFQNDSWRLRQLSKSLSHPQHPYHKFICGNLSTLRDGPAEKGLDIRKEFMAFYEREYSASKMKLVVLGREGLDVLQEWVVKLFSAIPNKPIPYHSLSTSPPPGNIQSYPPSHLGKLIIATSVMARRELHLRFVYQDEDHLSASQPGRYLMHLIGHEGPGSILSVLKSSGWANSLFAGPHPEGPENAFFMVYIHLTDLGLNHYEEVLEVVFGYLAMLRKEGVKRWIWDEIKHLADLEFRWKAKAQHIMCFTSCLANQMQKPLVRKEVVSGYDLLHEYDEAQIERAIGLLKPDRCNVTLVSNEYVRKNQGKGSEVKKEKWYGTEYILEDIPGKLMDKMERMYYGSDEKGYDGLYLPNPNPFIPFNPSVDRKARSRGVQQGQPTLLINNQHLRLWFKKDDTFFVPKANINILITSPLLDPSSVSLTNAVLADFYCNLVTDSLTEFSYGASLAGYTYSLQPLKSYGGGGICVSVSGYSDKVPILLEKVLTTIRELNIDEKQFERVKEEVVRSWRNVGFMEPYRQIHGVMEYLVLERGWTGKDKVVKLEKEISLGDFHAFKEGFLRQQTHLEWLIHGNISSTNATFLSQTLSLPFLYPINPFHTFFIPSHHRPILFPCGSSTYHHLLPDPSNPNNCVSYCLQLPAETTTNPKLRAQAALLALMLEEPAFDQLRTREQLGYIVFSGIKYIAGAAILYVMIQSRKACTYLEKRIEEFLQKFGEEVLGDEGRKMTEEEFERYKSSLETQLRKRWENMQAETGWYWDRIADGGYGFGRREEEVDALEDITREDMRQYFEENVLRDAKRRKFVVCLDRHDVDDDCEAHNMEGEEIKDIQGFKARAWLMPVPTPMSAIDSEMREKFTSDNAALPEDVRKRAASEEGEGQRKRQRLLAGREQS